nr:hypothetical protein [Tanacetum cinerariifolium]
KREGEVEAGAIPLRFGGKWQSLRREPKQLRLKSEREHHPRPGKTANGTRRGIRTGRTKLCFNKLAPSVGFEQNARPTRVEHHAG